MTEEVTNVTAVAETNQGQDTAPSIDPTEYADLKAENDRLKAFHDKVTQEKQQAVAKAKAEAEKAAKDKAESEGNYKELLSIKEKEYSEQLQVALDKIAGYETEKKHNTVNEAANKIANELSKSSTAKSKLLAEKLASRIKYTEDGLMVTDEKGKIISEKLESLVDFAKKEYDFLCDGLQSTGGAGVAVVKPTGVTNHLKLSPVDRINLARNIK